MSEISYYFAIDKIKNEFMINKENLKPLSEKEMSQLVGGVWIKKNGEWIWVSVKDENEYVENINSMQLHSFEF